MRNRNVLSLLISTGPRNHYWLRPEDAAPDRVGEPKSVPAARGLRSRFGRVSASSQLGSPETLDLRGRELPPCTCLEPVKRQPGVLAPVQATDRMADGGEHPLDLVLPPLVQDELDVAAAEPTS